MYLFQHKNSFFFNRFTLLVKLKRFYRFFMIKYSFTDLFMVLWMSFLCNRKLLRNVPIT